MDVSDWLRELGLERYEPVFRDNEIDWEVLSELTGGDLEKLGLPLGPRKKLLFKGELGASVQHVQRSLEIYDPVRHASSAVVLSGHDAKECGLTLGGNALLMLGFPDQALVWNEEGMRHALATDQPQVIVHALNWNVILPLLLDDLDTVRQRLDMAAPLIADHALSMYDNEMRCACWRRGWRCASTVTAGPRR